MQGMRERESTRNAHLGSAYVRSAWWHHGPPGVAIIDVLTRGRFLDLYHTRVQLAVPGRYFVIHSSVALWTTLASYDSGLRDACALQNFLLTRTYATCEGDPIIAGAFMRRAVN